MAHDHSHAPAAAGPSSERRLWAALALTTSFLLIEVVASFLTGSLALLSDAGHMATDAMGLGVALLAIKVGKRPADAKRTFGYRRLEILAAALNASGLFIVAGYVFFEAVRRFAHPSDVASLPMLIVAAAGLVINAAAMWLLRGGSEASLNVKGAYLEVWADFLGSVAVLVGAGLIWFTGARWIDPAIAVLIALWVLPRGWTLLRSALHVLLEGTPVGVNPSAVERTILAIPGVRGVHELHIWSVTTGVPLLSAHVRVERLDDWDGVLTKLCDTLVREHHIEHVTLQPEISEHCPTQGGPLDCES